MNKRELVDAVAAYTGSSSKVAAEAVDAILGTITATVAKGEKVAITGFGSFEKVDRKAREGRNPSTGATIQIAATSVPTFKSGADFKFKVADEGAKARAAH